VIRMLVTGARGQVGSEVVRRFEGRAVVIAHDRTTLDLASPAAIAEAVREAHPDLIVNAGAYTAVDRAESEPDAAHAVNAIAPGVLAEEAKRAGALLVHFSTDYVFDGTKAGPYVEDDATHPLGAYGRTKLEGEQRVIASGCRHLVLRTSWVYGPHGKNFMLTMLRLAQTRDELLVVDDQRGAPTSSASLARLLAEMLAPGGGEIARPQVDRVAQSSGLYHSSAQGETTWFGFARAIFAAAAERPGAVPRMPRLVAIPTREYPTPARRPANSVLSGERLHATFGVRIPDWRHGLAESVSALD